MKMIKGTRGSGGNRDVNQDDGTCVADVGRISIVQSTLSSYSLPSVITHIILAYDAQQVVGLNKSYDQVLYTIRLETVKAPSEWRLEV